MRKIVANRKLIAMESRALVDDPEVQLSEQWVVQLDDMEAAKVGRNWTYGAPDSPAFIRTRLRTALEFLGKRLHLQPD